jgi:hypothetical protein
LTAVDGAATAPAHNATLASGEAAQDDMVASSSLTAASGSAAVAPPTVSQPAAPAGTLAPFPPPPPSRTLLGKLTSLFRRVHRSRAERAMVTAALAAPPPEYAFYARIHPICYGGLSGSFSALLITFAKVGWAESR